MDADGGWTRIFNKVDRTSAFDGTWNSYRSPFGNLLGNYWIGLDNMHSLTADFRMKVRFELTSDRGAPNFIEYATFRVLSESDKYQLILSTKIGGNLFDNADYHTNMPFSTPDRDNDLSGSNCARSLSGGWWFQSCFYFCFTCESYSVAGHYKINLADYKFFPNITMLIKPY
jgi:ficolin